MIEPNPDAVRSYLKKWDTAKNLENYRIQEEALKYQLSKLTFFYGLSEESDSPRILQSHFHDVAGKFLLRRNGFSVSMVKTFNSML
jgi:hypothetical protein